LTDVIDEGAAFIHPTALVYGSVRIGAGASLWPYCVIRCESGEVEIGAMTNIQDFAMIHGGGVRIGANCSITHHCVIHAATVEDNCLIGIGAVIMDRAVIGANSIVAGGAFVAEGTVIPPNSVVMGAPGKVRRERNNFVANAMNAFAYYENARGYARGDHRVWASEAFRDAARARQEALEREFARDSGIG
jgi:carbonic anhydrase/acetyltransferase-like protein (isoleucine patch superfamily)